MQVLRAVLVVDLTRQVAKAHPNDRDARMKFTECNKIVKRIAFEKAISVADTKKSVVDQINLDSMSMFSLSVCEVVSKIYFYICIVNNITPLNLQG